MALSSFMSTFDQLSQASHAHQIVQSPAASVTGSDWREKLPVLSGSRVTVRDLRMSDAPALLQVLTTEEVTRFISPPPTTVEGFERFIAWANAQRAAGQYLCFAVAPYGRDTAVGIIQVRQLGQGIETAEWGFALGRTFWGTGLFVEAAELVLAFTFETIGVRRLEARAAVANGRGNGALLKLGARREAILRQSFSRGRHRLDQVLWSMFDEDWRRAKAARVARLSPDPRTVTGVH